MSETMLDDKNDNGDNDSLKMMSYLQDMTMNTDYHHHSPNNNSSSNNNTNTTNNNNNDNNSTYNTNNINNSNTNENNYNNMDNGTTTTAKSNSIPLQFGITYSLKLDEKGYNSIFNLYIYISYIS